MKFALTFKHPDVFDEIKEDARDKEEFESAKKFAENFVKYGEYLTVIFDTGTQTATVQKVK